ncbi:MAG: hypothetical protein JWM82_2985 [Myxococcales bacterium]|nr:hypothetical protein [Myxococcales bacterium]
MKRRLRFALPLVVALLTGLSGVANAQYVYSGPEYVNMAGTSCRATNLDARTVLQMNEGKLSNISSANKTVDVYCPFERRNLSAYGQSASSGTSAQIGTTIAMVTDNTTLDAFGCQIYAWDMDTNSARWSPTHWACATNFGCATKPAASFKGSNLFLGWPYSGESFPNASVPVRSVNLGLKCSVPKASDLLWIQSLFSE